jgi:hypothetical protein
MSPYDALGQLSILFAVFSVTYAVQRVFFRNHPEPPRVPKPMPQDAIDQIDKAW